MSTERWLEGRIYRIMFLDEMRWNVAQRSGRTTHSYTKLLGVRRRLDEPPLLHTDKPAFRLTKSRTGYMATLSSFIHESMPFSNCPIPGEQGRLVEQLIFAKRLATKLGTVYGMGR
jgi:hypothetical protein